MRGTVAAPCYNFGTFGCEWKGAILEVGARENSINILVTSLNSLRSPHSGGDDDDDGPWKGPVLFLSALP